MQECDNKYFKLLKFQFALLLSVQWYRLPDHKEAAYNFKQDSWNKEKEIIKRILAYQKNDTSFLDLDVSMITDPAIDHAEMYSPENAIQLAKVITENYWEFFYTDDDSIYTSDFPFIIEPHIESAPSYYNGFGMYGSEASFPINSNIVLVIWNKDYFKDKHNIDCQFTPLDANGIWRYKFLCKRQNFLKNK